MTHRTYYGFYYRYGTITLWQSQDGRHIYAGTLHAFATRAERDAWVAAGTVYSPRDHGYRGAVTRAWAIANGSLARSGTDETRAAEINSALVDHRYAALADHVGA